MTTQESTCPLFLREAVPVAENHGDTGAGTGPSVALRSSLYDLVNLLLNVILARIQGL